MGKQASNRKHPEKAASKTATTDQVLSPDAINEHKQKSPIVLTEHSDTKGSGVDSTSMEQPSSVLKLWNWVQPGLLLGLYYSGQMAIAFGVNTGR